MKSINLLMDEHTNIKRILGVTRKLAIQTMETGEVDFDSYYKVIDFVRNYADRHHHSKEEEILFKKMAEELGELMEKGPITAMFSEHDLGRLFIFNLEQALHRFKDGEVEARVDIIANAIAYTDLLYRHIEKEDSTIYTYGANHLKEESSREVESRVDEIEQRALEQGIQDKYMEYVRILENRLG